MSRTFVSNLIPGMKLKENVRNGNGIILLAKDTILTDRYIERLDFHDIDEIEVEDQTYDTPITEGELVYRDAVTSIKEIMHQVISCKKVNEKLITTTVSAIVDQVIENSSTFMSITDLKNKDTFTFFHCVNVCIYATIAGKKLSFSRDDLLTLGTAALLHDIGKSKIPDSILLKPGRLLDNEFEIMKKHSIYGYEIIKEKTNLDNLIANIILQHHEKWDGSGYPSGVKGSDIHRFARIITISDIYDALTSDRVYRKKFPPHKAAEYILESSNKILDPDLITLFIENIAIYPIGSKVVLNTGEIGKVTYIEEYLPFRPKIEVLGHVDNKNIDPYILDLIENPSVSITNVI